MVGPDDKIIIPKVVPDEVYYEAELAIVIGKKAKNFEVKEVRMISWDTPVPMIYQQETVKDG